mmetsp:Transcript_19893/g.55554  ORF Transcript_19893/g.55554 Transcript_19893/m.55554 type:complete len:276 (-) Transcript_19893:164-991(-)
MMTEMKELELVLPAPTSTNPKPSWADLSEDVEDGSTGVDTDSQGHSDAPGSSNDADSASSGLHGSPKGWQSGEGQQRRKPTASSGGAQWYGWAPPTRNNVKEQWHTDISSYAPSSGTASSRQQKKQQQQKRQQNAAVGGGGGGGFGVPVDFPTDAFCVVVEGMPARLCNEVCLEGVLDQADLQGQVVSQRTQSGPKAGVAVIVLTSWLACVQCYNHFATSSWSKNALTVTCHYPNEDQPGASDPAKEEEDTSSAEAQPEGPKSSDGCRSPAHELF